MDPLELVNDGESAVLIVECLSGIALEGQMGLTACGECALNDLDGSILLGLVEHGLCIALDNGLIVELVGNARNDGNSIGQSGLEDIVVNGELLVFDTDLLCCGAGVLAGICSDKSDGLAHSSDLHALANENVGMVRLDEGTAALSAAHIVRALDILVGDDSDNAGHLLCFGGVYLEDVCMSIVRKLNSEVEHAFGHLACDVACVVGDTHDLAESSGTGIAGGMDAGPVGGFGVEGGSGSGAVHNGSSCHNSVDQGLITGAAAEVIVLGEPITNFLTGDVGILVKQSLGGHNEARGAEATLNSAVLDPCLLQRVKVGSGADTLYRLDNRVLGELAHLFNAGADGFAVNNDRAGAALTGAAADFEAGKSVSAEDRCESILFSV